MRTNYTLQRGVCFKNAHCWNSVVVVHSRVTSCSLFRTQNDMRKITSSTFFQDLSRIKSPTVKHRPPNSAEQNSTLLFSNLWQHRRRGCVSKESESHFPTRTWGSDNGSIDSVFWPPPARHQLTWKKQAFKKMLLIINWDASVFSLSGIWAMHWLSEQSKFFASSESHSAPVSGGF